jgi:hypothetical protein
MNLGEFRKLTEGMPDSTEMVSVAKNYELGGSYVKASAYRKTMEESERRFRDDFDGTSYSKRVFHSSKEGGEVILIQG